MKKTFETEVMTIVQMLWMKVMAAEETLEIHGMQMGNGRIGGGTVIWEGFTFDATRNHT